MPDTEHTPNPLTEMATRASVAQKLFDSRTILVCGEIDSDGGADGVMGQLLAMSASSDNDIDLYINSPGGHVGAGDTILDMIRFVGRGARHRHRLGGQRRSPHLSRRPREDRSACPTRAFCSISPGAAPAVAPPISRSRRRRS